MVLIVSKILRPPEAVFFGKRSDFTLEVEESFALDRHKAYGCISGVSQQAFIDSYNEIIDGLGAAVLSVETSEKATDIHLVRDFDRALVTRRRRSPHLSHAISPDFWGAIDKPRYAFVLLLQGDAQGFKLSPARANDTVGPSLILFG
jgi:hypothetical protein